MIKALGNVVVCEPTNKDRHVRTKINAGFAVSDQITSLIPLKVLYSSSECDIIQENGVVWVRGEQLDGLPWGSKIYSINDKKAILVPLDQVVLYQDGE